MRFSGTQLRPMSEGALKISICKMILNDALVKLLQHLSWANGLTHSGPVTPCGDKDLGQHWLR